MNFFFDTNLSPYLAQAINCLEREGEVVHLTEKFPGDTPDEDWLKYVGKNNLILITKDKKIKRRVAELRAIKKYKVRAFVLTCRNRDNWEIALQLIKKWREIKELAAKNIPPFAFKVPFAGKIEKLSL